MGLSSLVIGPESQAESARGRLPKNWKLHIGAIAGVFIASRALAFFMGLHYLSGEPAHDWQLLDLGILRYHLVRGILNLHAQPPLFNIMFGMAEKAAGSHFGVVLLGLQLCLGLSAAVAVYLTLVRLRVATALSLSVVAILLLNPAAILFEFDPLYTELVYALNCFIALGAVCYIQTRSRGALWSVIGIALLLTLVRSSYQPVWLVLISGVLFWGISADRRRIMTAAIAGLLLTLIWPAKNYILFHHFVSSTWAPFSMSRHWKYPADRRRIEPLVEQGLVPTFSPRPSESGAAEKEFPAWLAEHWPAARAGVPELDDVAKDNGFTNWNSLAMLRMHDAEAKDVSFLLRHAPKSYLLNIGRGLAVFFEPSTIYFKGMGRERLLQYEEMAPVDRMVSRVCCNIFGLPPEAYGPLLPQKLRLKNFCIGAVALYAACFGCLLSIASSSFWAGSADRRLASMFMLATVAYSFVLTSLVEVGENMRFRFETHSLAVMVTAILIQQLWARRGMLRGRHIPVNKG